MEYYSTTLNNSQNTNLTERSVIILQCDPEFSLVGAVTVTYNNSCLCDPDPALLECMCLSVMPACMYAAELPIDGASAILVLLLLEVLLVLYSVDYHPGGNIVTFLVLKRKRKGD